jgi:hypothetical protein
MPCRVLAARNELRPVGRHRLEQFFEEHRAEIAYGGIVEHSI